MLYATNANYNFEDFGPLILDNVRFTDISECHFSGSSVRVADISSIETNPIDSVTIHGNADGVDYSGNDDFYVVNLIITGISDSKPGVSIRSHLNHITHFDFSGTSEYNNGIEISLLSGTADWAQCPAADRCSIYGETSSNSAIVGGVNINGTHYIINTDVEGISNGASQGIIIGQFSGNMIGVELVGSTTGGTYGVLFAPVNYNCNVTGSIVGTGVSIGVSLDRTIESLPSESLSIFGIATGTSATSNGVYINTNSHHFSYEGELNIIGEGSTGVTMLFLSGRMNSLSIQGTSTLASYPGIYIDINVGNDVNVKTLLMSGTGSVTGMSLNKLFDIRYVDAIHTLNSDKLIEIRSELDYRISSAYSNTIYTIDGELSTLTFKFRLRGAGSTLYIKKHGFINGEAIINVKNGISYIDDGLKATGSLVLEAGDPGFQITYLCGVFNSTSGNINIDLPSVSNCNSGTLRLDGSTIVVLSMIGGSGDSPVEINASGPIILTKFVSFYILSFYKN